MCVFFLPTSRMYYMEGCGCCSLQTGTIFVGLLSLIEAAGFVAAMLFSEDCQIQGLEDELGDTRPIVLWGFQLASFIIAGITLVATLLLWIGACKSLPKLLIPWLILSFIAVILILATGVLSAIFLIIREAYLLATATFLVMLVSSYLRSFCIYVVLSLRHELLTLKMIN